jgi:predicted nuclease of predicted toxin-antitoxin system
LVFRQPGYTVYCLRDYIRQDAPDDQVLAQAQQMDTILVSLNGDFSDIVRYPPSQYKGILSLQVKNHPEIIPHILSNLTEYLAQHTNSDYFQSKLFLVEAHRIRVRQ